MNADERWMRRANELALEGWGQTAPNPLVGAVVVRDGSVVGEGAHRRFGEAHAEVIALGQAGSLAEGAALYVTLEPCAHTGKTPPCVEAIVQARIARVVAALPDPNPEAGGGAQRLRDAGVQVDTGPDAEAARELNAPFLNSFGSVRPWVTLKLAVSLDGAIADRTRAPAMISGPTALKAAHRLRAGSDAVAVGMGTVLADDPQLTVRDAPAPRVAPLRVVFSTTGRLPLTSRLAQTAHEVPVLVFAESIEPAYENALRELGVEVLTTASLEEALQVLKARGVNSLLVEGGAGLAASLINARLVDRLMLVQSPVLLGAGALPAFSGLPGVTVAGARRLRRVRRDDLDDDVVSVFALEP